MQLHRLEIFYHVVRHGGITAAARHNPWGLGRTAISKSMTAFERELGTPLFKREPFELLPFGERVWEQTAPLYEKIVALSRESAGLRGALLRVGASPYVLKEYLLPLLALLRRRHPDLRLQLRAGRRDETEDRLRRDEIDVAVLTVDAPPAECHWQPLLERPVVVFAPAGHPAADGWELAAQRPRLITPPETEAVTRRFGAALRARNMYWPVAIVASETAEVPVHVQAGDCVGLGVGVAALLALPGIRALPLPGLEPVTIGAGWRSEFRELRTMLELAVQAAQSIGAHHGVVEVAGSR